MSEAQERSAAIRNEGYAVVPELISRREVDEIKTAVARIVEHPDVLAVIDEFLAAHCRSASRS
jgi:hypothetical protein